MSVVYDFGNSQNWVYLWGGEFTGQSVSAEALYKYYPLEPIDVPIQAAFEVIAVYPESNTDPGNWNYAGLVLQRINTGITGGGVADADIDTKKIFLKRINIIRFQRLSSTYSIRFRIPWWLRHISLTVWEYTGLIEETIETQLDNIELKIDQLL